MMISPDAFRREHENDSDEEIQQERERLLDTIAAMVREIGVGGISCDMSPSPETRISMSYKYLRELDNIEIERYRKRMSTLEGDESKFYRMGLLRYGETVEDMFERRRREYAETQQQEE